MTTNLFRFNDRSLDSCVWTHKSCTCNERIALEQRHQVDDGSKYTSQLNLKKLLRRYVSHVSPISYDQVIGRASARKRVLLEQAKESLVYHPVEDKDGHVRMFLKDDKSHVPEYKAPRCIQYRNKRYGLPLASFMTPMEHKMCTWLDCSDTPIFAKGRNMIQRGRDIEAKMGVFRDPVAISMDHSKFDAHANVQLLKLEHWFYRQCNRSRLLAYLLYMQLNNKGWTKNGTKFFTPGTRMSGDQNTGCGNSLINFMMTLAMMEELGIQYCIYIDGDDFIVFVERCHAHLVKPEWYTQFGMVTKIEAITSTIEHIEFCQTRPVFDGVSYTMVRNPTRMLARLQWCVGYKHPRHKANYLTSVGRCMMSLGMGLPVEQFVGSTLSKIGGRYIATNLHHRANQMYVRPLAARISIPTLATRLSYESAWGISIPEQYHLESLTLVDPDITCVEFDEEPFVRA